MDKKSILFVVLLAATFYVMQMFFPPQKAQVPQPIERQVQKKEEITTPHISKRPITEIDQKEKFYVLSNDYQQLVFSTKGGSIAEINLPFRTEKNKRSIINEIDFDRKIVKASSENARFPLHPYYVLENDKIQKKEEGTLSGYYPLIRRQIIGDTQELKSYYALNIIDDNSSIEDLNFEVTRFEKNLIEFELVQSNRRIVKTYKFADNAPYVFDLNLKIDGDSKNLWITTGVPEVELTSGAHQPILKLRTTRKQKNVVEKVSLPKTATNVSTIYPDWISNSNGFLGIIVDPLDEIAPGYRAKHISGENIPTRLTLIDQEYNLFPASKYPGYEMFLPLRSVGQSTNFRVYSGPFARNMLVSVDEVYSNPVIGYSPDYIEAQSFDVWLSFVSVPFAKLMFSLMQLFHKTTHSWGISIILLTIVLKLMLYPLNAWSIKSNLRMQEIAPQMKAIQKKHEKNPQKAKIEVMNLYRSKGVNPLMGCFPIFIQMPFLLGMFALLKSTFELRGSAFIPGWINNLTAPDILFSWSHPIPLIGTEFHLLPILLGVVMYFQSKISSKLPKDKSELTDQQKQQKMMSSILPIVFTVMFYKLPSGLNLYWFFSMLLGIIQQWMMNKKMKKISLVKDWKK